MKSFTRLTRYLLGAVAMVALAATGCGDEKSTEGAPSRPRTITVEAVDYGFVGLPARIPAGSTLKLTNQSKNEAHELVAFRLPENERRSSAELVKLPEQELMGMFSGPPALVLLAPPGGAEQVIAEGDGSLKEPGRYLVLCTIPTGADPAAFLNTAGESRVEGGPPHFAHGMHAELLVE